MPAQLDSNILKGAPVSPGNNFPKPCGFHKVFVKTDVVALGLPSRTPPLDLPMTFNTLYSYCVVFVYVKLDDSCISLQISSVTSTWS